jgi:hypothetical protein
VTGKRNETLTTNLKYPMVDLFTGSVMPLMYFNTLAAWYLLALTGPWLLMELWMKGPESERDQSGQNQRGVHSRQKSLKRFGDNSVSTLRRAEA